MEITVSNEKNLKSNSNYGTFSFSVETPHSQEIDLKNTNKSNVEVSVGQQKISLDCKQDKSKVTINGQAPLVTIEATNQNNNCDLEARAISENYLGLAHKPSINGVILQGDQTSEDLLINEDKNFVFTPETASDIWVIQHNLNKRPSVTVIDSAGEEVIGDVFYDNLNQVTVKFKHGGFKGIATLN